ncbi:NUDIX domain-containing protein [Streptomyces sp. NPDC126499]|uniref:NUDIX hydrolase n=1 Tax=Streptomyces sp. NPDC126499 TaxID=3155314 RepID=UPI003333C519
MGRGGLSGPGPGPGHDPAYEPGPGHDPAYEPGPGPRHARGLAGAVEFVDAERVDFTECPPPPLSPEERREVDRLWARTTARNPATFDGPLVASLGLDRPAPGRRTVRWARMTYRHRALRELRPAEDVPGSVFVTVLLPTDEGLVVGRGSAATAAPGRWTLPGGAAEPPAPGLPLDLAVLRRHAVRELAEELGVRVPHSAPRLWAVTRQARFGSLGFHFLAPPVPAALVRRRHAALAAAQSAYGAGCGVGPGPGPELDAIAFVSAPRTVAAPEADYLPQLLDRYFQGPRTDQPGQDRPGRDRPGRDRPGPDR